MADEHSTEDTRTPQGVIRHPEANLSLFLGIASILFSLGPLGLAMATFGMIAATRSMRAYKKEPDKYTRSSFQRGLAGLICSLVSVGLFLLGSFLYVALI